LVAPGMMKCILLFSFAFKLPHDATFKNFIGQTHVQINKPLLILKNHARDVAKYLVMGYFATSHKIYHMENKYTRYIL
jgi:hypothetical protein